MCLCECATYRYPMTDSLIDEAIVWGDSTRLDGMLKKLKRLRFHTGRNSDNSKFGSDSLVIAAIGGSFTQGTGCDDLVSFVSIYLLTAAFYATMPRSIMSQCARIIWIHILAYR